MGATMKKYKRSIFIMVLMLVLSTSVFAGDIKSDRETLKNLKGVHVHVQDLNQDIEQAGLSKDQIRTDVELKLRLAGIKVLTLLEHYEGKGAPYLHIYLDSHKTEKGEFVYSLSFGIIQEVRLVRNNTITDAITWSISGVGYNNIEGIRAHIKDRADKFINDYLSVNPKI
jgi:hypothetical protein